MLLHALLTCISAAAQIYTCNESIRSIRLEKNLQVPVNGYARSETTLIYYKLSVMLVNNLKIGKAIYPFDFGLVAAVPHSVKNEHDRLRKADLRSFNIAARVSLGRIIYNGAIAIQLTYSGDLLNNLEDSNIYNTSGDVIGKQKSKVHLLSLQLTFSPWIK